MMRVDAWTHFIPKPFADRVAQIAGNVADIGKRMREIPCFRDLGARRRVVDKFPDYAQVLSYAMPPIENIVPAEQTEELCRLINDGFVDICAKDKDHFPGWVAQVSLASPEGAVREAERAVKNGALGVQTYTNIKGKPLDRPEFAPFFATMARLRQPGWVHPPRGAGKVLVLRWVGAPRWVSRARRRHVAPRLLENPRQQSGPEAGHAPFRRHRADARRPHRPGLGPDPRPHLGRGLSG